MCIITKIQGALKSQLELFLNSVVPISEELDLKEKSNPEMR